MDIIVKKSDLFKELQYVQGVVERKTTVPILSNLLLETSGNRLGVTATDLDVTLQCFCKADVKIAGSLTISARKLFDMVRLLPDSDIHFKASTPDWMNVTCERARFKIAGVSKENFPDVPTVEGETVGLPASAIRYMISRCVFAITQEESRYTLNGALMIINPESLTFVTTDGHRLVLISHQKEIEGCDSETRVLVPKKTLVELNKLAAEDIETIEFGNTDKHLFFRAGDRLLVSRILTGQFPNYEMVIPTENNREVVLEVDEFVDALKRVAVMADEQSQSVRFLIQEGQLEISSASSDFGEAKEAIPATYSKEQIEIGFNAQYLLDFLTAVDSNKIIMALRDHESQGLLKPKSNDSYQYLYVIMPLKI
jgi:DNA polymerase-3 subunit beta